MPALIISCQNQMQWVITIANTNVVYNFNGVTVQQQANEVRALANEMIAGPNFEIDNLSSILRLPNNIEPGQIFQQLFAETDSIMYNGVPAYACYDEDDTLIDVLDEAGTALEALLPAI